MRIWRGNQRNNNRKYGFHLQLKLIGKAANKLSKRASVIIGILLPQRGLGFFSLARLKLSLAPHRSLRRHDADKRRIW